MQLTPSNKRSNGLIMMSSPVRVPKIIIAGAPAAGKGTQCENIVNDLGVVHLSTGDMLRAAVKAGTELGLKAKAAMDSGLLVSDDLIIGVICDRLREDDCVKKGWLLDGFPRTKAQAEALSKAGMVPDCFVLLDVPEKVLVERVTGRRTDPVTGKIYHLKFNPPPDAEVSNRLVQRSDDTEEKIVVRYKEFQSHIDSIQSCYADKMVWVDGSMSQREVKSCILDSLASVKNQKKGAVFLTKEINGNSVLGQLRSRIPVALGLASLIAIDKYSSKFSYRIVKYISSHIASLSLVLK